MFYLILLVIAWVAAMWAGSIAAVVLYPVLLLTSTVVAIGLYLMQVRATLVPDSSAGLSPVVPVAAGKGRDPAYPHYLSRQVWKDWTAILRTASPRIAAKAQKALGTVSGTLMGGQQGWFLFPVWLAICGGILSAAVPVFVVAVLIMTLYAATVVLGLLVWLVCVGLLRLVDQAFVLAYRILQTCPYPGCYSRFTLPVYACPTCGNKHAKLRPDLNGAARHVCQCGTRLPTTILLGRYRLQAFCPHCERLLPTRVGRVRIEPLPFVGGPDAGKTTFMALSVDAIHGAVNEAGGRAFFADKTDELAFRRLRVELSTGRISKTGAELPKAVMLDIALPGKTGGDRILYLFDPSGEHYTGASKVEEMRYLSHGEALILVIDPFALPDVQAHLLQSEREMLTAKGVSLSPEDPADTFTRLRNELASRADGGKQRRVAVVLSKADLLRGTTSGRGIDDLRTWLKLMGLGNLVRELDHQRADVRFFASGLPPRRAEIAELLGWLAGLRLSAHPAEAAGGHATEPAAGDARRPWDSKPRPSGRPPLSYLIFRRGLAAAITLTSALTVILFSVLLLNMWLPNDAPALDSTASAIDPSATAAPIGEALAGRWRGLVHQSNVRDYHVELTLKEGAALGDRAGAVNYPELDCSGTLTLEPVTATGATMLREEIDEDPEDRCIPTSWLALQPDGSGEVSLFLYVQPEDASGGSPLAYAQLSKDP